MRIYTKIPWMSSIRNNPNIYMASLRPHTEKRSEHPSLQSDDFYFKEIPNTTSEATYVQLYLWPLIMIWIYVQHPIWYEHNYVKRLKLTNIEELGHLRTIAEDRDEWYNLTQSILKAARAESTVAGSATEH